VNDDPYVAIIVVLGCIGWMLAIYWMIKAK